MAEKTLNTRMIQKHDTTANWNKATNFVPKAGELILYTDVNKMKMGDGTTKVGSLPFVTTDLPDISGKENTSNKVTSWSSTTTDAHYPSEKLVKTALDAKLNLSGGTVTGDLIVTAPHRDNYYASNVCRHFSNNTPTEYVIKTKIKYLSSQYMPLIRIYGYAYGLQSPIELRLGFYIYDNQLGWCGAVSTGAWKPNIFLFSYTENDTKYVAVGFKGSCYFCGFQVDVQVGALGSFNSDFSIDGWSTSHNGANTSKHIVPDVGVDDCVAVTYKTMKTDIEGTASNSSKLNNQDPAYYLNYNNLSNKPTIPSAVTESTVSGWGFTKNTGTYSKPSTGIPKTDLASAVQTSLGKADSALQSFTETDPTVPAWAKASTKPTYTASEVGARPDTWTPTKSDVGLSNVGNFKAVSTVASQGLTSTEKSNARTNIGAASSSHTHGNITNAGALQTTDVTIANGDKIVVTDASNSNKVARTSTSFDGSTTDSFLSKKGTFEAPPKIYTARNVSSLPSAASVPLNSIGFARSSMSASSLLYIVRSENVVDPCTGQTYRTWNYLI